MQVWPGGSFWPQAQHGFLGRARRGLHPQWLTSPSLPQEAWCPQTRATLSLPPSLGRGASPVENRQPVPMEFFPQVAQSCLRISLGFGVGGVCGQKAEGALVRVPGSSTALGKTFSKTGKSAFFTPLTRVEVSSGFERCSSGAGGESFPMLRVDDSEAVDPGEAFRATMGLKGWL